MNVYDAIEQAYKNGYKAGIKDFVELLKESEKYGTYDWESKEIIFSITDINNLAQEMRKGGDEKWI